MYKIVARYMWRHETDRSFKKDGGRVYYVDCNHPLYAQDTALDQLRQEVGHWCGEGEVITYKIKSCEEINVIRV